MVVQQSVLTLLSCRVGSQVQQHVSWAYLRVTCSKQTPQQPHGHLVIVNKAHHCICCRADDVQLEFVMLDPYVRVNLTHDNQVP